MKIVLSLIVFVCLFNRCSSDKVRMGHFYDGGYVFELDQNKRSGYMVSVDDLSRQANWSEAMELYASFRGGGYDNWTLPTKDSWRSIYESFCKKEIGHF